MSSWNYHRLWTILWAWCCAPSISLGGHQCDSDCTILGTHWFRSVQVHLVVVWSASQGRSNSHNIMSCYLAVEVIEVVLCVSVCALSQLNRLTYWQGCTLTISFTRPMCPRCANHQVGKCDLGQFHPPILDKMAKYTCKTVAYAVTWQHHVSSRTNVDITDGIGQFHCRNATDLSTVLLKVNDNFSPKYSKRYD